MLKNIFQKIRSLWRNNIEDTTKEWEEIEETQVETHSKYKILVDAPIIDRIKFLFTNKMAYRLTKHQFVTIKRNPLKEEF